MTTPAQNKKWREANPERYKQLMDFHNAKKRGQPRNLENQLLKQKLEGKRLRKAAIAAYGGACSCCGETFEEFLTLDHINGGGHKERKSGVSTLVILTRLEKAGWPKEGHRILCMNCNFSIGIRGYCPHQRVN